MFLKYELFVYILKSTKRMNKFDRVSAKLQTYFQTRVFYVLEQNNAIWKKIYGCFARSYPTDIIASNES